MLQYCFCFMFCFFGCEACGILAPRPVMEPAPPALEGDVLTTGLPGKSLSILFLTILNIFKSKKNSTSILHISPPKSNNCQHFAIFVSYIHATQLTYIDICIILENIKSIYKFLKSDIFSWEKFIVLSAYIKKEQMSQMNSLTLYLKELEKEEKTKLKARRKNIVNIRAERNKIDNRKTIEKINETKILVSASKRSEN